MKDRNILRFVSLLVMCSFLAGCATPPEKISSAYVSPLQYQGYSCNQIRQELIRVNRKILEVSGQQSKEANKDAVALGVGLVLFWPALFFMIGEDKKEELARLKGEYEALENIAIQKDCDIAAELEEAKKEREKYEKEKNKNYPDEETNKSNT